MKKIQKLFKEFYNRICGHVRGWLQHLESSETFSLMTNHKYIYACITLVICIGSSIFYVSKGSLNIFIIIAFVCCLCIYFMLYTFLNLSKSIFSFVLFSILMLMFILFLRRFLLVCKGFSHPIFVEQISIFSQYRYIIFTMGALLIFILYVFAFFFSKIKHLLDIMSFPYLKEDVLSTEDNLIHTNKENLQFKFTSYALQEGYYGDISLNSLSDSWLRLAAVSTKVKFFDDFFFKYVYNDFRF